MNFGRITTWIVGILLAASVSGQLPKIQRMIWRAQAQIIYESRTSTWGSPRFWAPEREREREQKDKIP